MVKLPESRIGGKWLCICDEDMYWNSVFYQQLANQSLFQWYYQW